MFVNEKAVVDVIVRMLLYNSCIEQPEQLRQCGVMHESGETDTYHILIIRGKVILGWSGMICASALRRDRIWSNTGTVCSAAE